MTVPVTARRQAIAKSRVQEDAKVKVTTGAAAAAILAAGLGSFIFGVVVTLTESVPAIKTALTLSKAVGPLSGKTTVSIVLWLASWLVLGSVYKGKNPALGRILAVALALIVLGFVLTFPPVYQTLSGE